MGPWYSSDERVLPIAKEWLDEKGVLFADVYMPHSGHSGNLYLICKLSQFIRLLDDAPFNSVIMIFKGSFIFHGHLDEQMSIAFQEKFSEGEDWWVLEGNYYPDEVEILASGSSWSHIESELMDEPERLINVYIGREITYYPDYWIENTDNNIMILRKPVPEGSEWNRIMR